MRFLGHLGRALTLAASFAAICSAQGPSFTAAGVVNAASGGSVLAPRARANIMGANLGPLQIVTAPTPAGAAELAGVQVLFGQTPGALIDVSDTVITVDIPAGLNPGPVDVVVRYNGIASEPVTINLQPYAPAFYTTIAPDGTVTGAFGSTDTISTDNPASPGEALTGVANGLGAASGDPPMQLTDAVPALTVGCDPAPVQASFLNTDFGTYQIDFAVPQGAPGGLVPVSITIGGQTSPSVLLPVSGAPVPDLCAAVNAASSAPGQAVAPGSIISLYGVNLAAATNLQVFPNTLADGVAVTFNGTAAPLFALLPGQINVLVPPELPETGIADVVVMTAEGSTEAFELELTTAAPGVFPVPDPREPAKIYAAAQRGNTRWLAIPAGMAQALGLTTSCVDPLAFCGEPIRRGDALEIYATGVGRATLDGSAEGEILAGGQVAPSDGTLYRTVEPPTVSFGDAVAQALFSGRAPGFAGTDQINVIVPEDAPVGDEVALTIEASNGMSTTILVAVQ